MCRDVSGSRIGGRGRLKYERLRMNGEPLALLLIEDDPRLARFTSEYLERHGARVTLVTDGQQGLLQALRRVHDAVILDLMLPTMDGLDVCRQIRNHSDVPILMVTARIGEIDRVRGLESGADDVLRP